MKLVKNLSFTEDIKEYFLKNASMDEIRNAASRLCRDYLTGRWKSITSEDIVVKRISGGLSNFLYYISLPEEQSDKNSNNLCNSQTAISTSKRQRKDSAACGDEPTEVLLRIYGQTHGEHALETMITESVVFALLSERNLGPKLHGLFPGGRIEQYIPARPLRTLELSDYKTSMKIAEKMGEIHSLHIPVSKEPEWLWNTMQRWLKSLDSIIQNISPEDEEKSEVKEIKKIDFAKEVEWVRNLVDSGDYPVVFCHNDLQEGNILLREETSRSRRASVKSSSSLAETENEASSSLSSDRNANASSGLIGNQSRKRLIPSDDSYTDLDNSSDSVISNDSDDCEPDLMIIDFEYCAYNYRGFDLANHFIEWTIDYSNPQFPFYFHTKEQYPTKEQRQDFISAYLRKDNEDIENYTPTAEEIEAVDQEVQMFSMITHLFWALWSVVNVFQNIEFGYWEYAVSRIREYQLLKNKYDAAP
ncbi:choline/ethanolamine kinase isoform X2 [Episyrphus balteatus]|uniref:choline/ethanolamine kinase isoform X2 n=1 Tax=Episyrphus balteatus TaxID=286459 RepID=UPI0024862B47|nr:choline/ethanolamine kinase isoform X2 [Episyrphus balteatus]